VGHQLVIVNATFLSLKSNDIDTSLFLVPMENSKRQVTIIDELWDNEQSDAVGRDSSSS
jgi:hypothetical protein